MPGFGLRADRRWDPRNMQFPMGAVAEPDERKLPNAAYWLTRQPPFDQDDTGTCAPHVGEMFLLYPPVVQKKRDAFPNRWDIYRMCVSLDEWPENDEQAALPDADPGMDFGTSTLALMKALKQYGLIGTYRWAQDVAT